MIGTDIIDKRRIATLYQKHGQRLAEKQTTARGDATLTLELP